MPQQVNFNVCTSYQRLEGGFTQCFFNDYCPGEEAALGSIVVSLTCTFSAMGSFAYVIGWPVVLLVVLILLEAEFS